MARPIIALLTDFGTRDHYAGTMKAVVLGICPDATLVDISHDIPPHDVLTAALELAACYKYFPLGTIFLVVVDPGWDRRAAGIAVDTGDYRFVAPDNGVLTAVLKETPAEARRRADRAALRAAHGEQHVRGTRSLCAGGRVAGEGRRSLRARPFGAEYSAAGDSGAGGDRATSQRRSPARRSLRQSRDQHRSQAVRQVHAVERRSRFPAGPHRIGRVVATYAEAAAGESARCSAAPITWRSR